jgi:hypothetical protein
MGYPASFQSTPPLRFARHRRRGRRGRVGYHVVLVFAGIGSSVAGLAAAASYLQPRQAVAVTGTTVAPSLMLGGRVGAIRFGGARVVPVGVGKLPVV